MSEKSAIEWTQATWNPLLGCTKVSPGCAACYAVNHVRRMAGNPNPKIAAANADLTERHANGKIDWTGRVRSLPERLTEPLTWRKPTMIFVNSLSDLFHEQVPDAFIAQVFAIMSAAPQHTFQVLTKRPERMAALLAGTAFWRLMLRERLELAEDHGHDLIFGRALREADRLGLAYDPAAWPLPNVWLGTSAERQREGDGRIPHLLATPAAVRWLSAEPLLGPLDLGDALHGYPLVDYRRSHRLDWVVAGGQSGGRPGDWLVGACPVPHGPHAACPACRSTGWAPRDDALAWARALRDQCAAVGVPFFFKQWGGPTSKAGGRLLDGRTWDEMPAVAGWPALAR